MIFRNGAADYHDAQALNHKHGLHNQRTHFFKKNELWGVINAVLRVHISTTPYTLGQGEALHLDRPNTVYQDTNTSKYANHWGNFDKSQKFLRDFLKYLENYLLLRLLSKL